MVFFCKETASVCQKYSKTSKCFNHQALLEKNDKFVRDKFSKVYVVNCDDISIAASGRWNGWSWGFIRIFISTSCFFGLSLWCEWLSQDDLLELFEECLFTKALFNFCWGKYGSQWFDAVPCKTLRLKLEDQQLRIPIVSPFGANICVAHTCYCSKIFTRSFLHQESWSFLTSCWSFLTLNYLIKQRLETLVLPSMLQLRGLHRTAGKRPDDETMILWEMGKQLVFSVTVMDALASSHLNQVYLYNTGTIATEVEPRKFEKYRELIDNWYIFKPVAIEKQDSLDEWSKIFVKRFRKVLCHSHEDHRAGSFLKQWISIAFQTGNAPCLLGTASDSASFEELQRILFLCLIAAFVTDLLG